MNRPKPSIAVAIFVKTPGLSPIKTRLAAGLGKDRAEECHRRSAACIAQVVSTAGLPGHWAVAETEALDHPLWCELPRLAQGAGSLGQRMARIHSELLRHHSAAVLLGADLPQLQAKHLNEAAEWLMDPKPRAILGPARDGGFWLFGANRPAAETRWTRVSYSRPDTATAFRSSLEDQFLWKELEPLTDLDSCDELERVRAELEQIPDPLPCQIEIRDWLAVLPGRSP